MSRATAALDRLLELMARLRDPETGCPWDREQSFATIAPYTIEEAYEVADAIARDDAQDLKGELGDLLFQVVFHGRLGEERGWFDFADIAEAITAKMVARHPHVFSEGSARNAAEQTSAWEDQKAAERLAKAAEGGHAHSLLDDVPRALPALTRAVKLQKRATRIGFDWPDLAPVFKKLDEEIGELRAELDGARDAARLADELGDVLFVLANVARHLGLDPEAALRGTNGKFERRFRHIEYRLGEPAGTPRPLAELDALWNEAKTLEAKPGR